MRNMFLSTLAAGIALLICGCSLGEKYQKNNSAAQAWLNAGPTRAAAADFEGVYYSPNWGMVVLNQQNGKITGSIGYMHVDGRATGKSARLLLVDDSWVEHTMLLTRKSSEILEGTYSSSVPYSKDDAEPVRLDRIVD